VRYIIRPRADWRDDTPLLEGKTVYEREPGDTGLLDKDGNKIWRVMSPIGFVELKERRG
jgi:hypothetical protein